MLNLKTCFAIAASAVLASNALTTAYADSSFSECRQAIPVNSYASSPGPYDFSAAGQLVVSSELDSNVTITNWDSESGVLKYHDNKKNLNFEDDFTRNSLGQVTSVTTIFKGTPLWDRGGLLATQETSSFLFYNDHQSCVLQEISEKYIEGTEFDLASCEQLLDFDKQHPYVKFCESLQPTETFSHATAIDGRGYADIQKQLKQFITDEKVLTANDWFPWSANQDTRKSDLAQEYLNTLQTTGAGIFTPESLAKLSGHYSECRQYDEQYLAQTKANNLEGDDFQTPKPNGCFERQNYVRDFFQAHPRVQPSDVRFNDSSQKTENS